MSLYKEIFNKINRSKKVAVISHKSPDGDCLGSGMAMYYILKKMDKNVDLYCDDSIHQNYAFLVNNCYNSELKNVDYDLVISVDCGDLKRLGKFEQMYVNHSNTINIDHHMTNENFGVINCVEPERSSTCELLYDIFVSNECEIDLNTATALYCGIATDTGCFIHNNTKENTHIVAGKLIGTGIDLDYIHYNLFKKKSLPELRLLEESLKSLELFSDNKIAISYITQKVLKKYKQNENAYIGVVNMITNLEESEVGVSMVELKDNSYKISLRSKGRIDVSVIAQKFGGGGHKMAAGCKIFGKAHKVIKLLVEAINQELCTME